MGVFADGIRPELRFGLISDVHFSPKKGVADKRFREALEWFRSKEVDAIVCTGDLTNCGMQPELENLACVWTEVFPGGCRPDGRRVERVFLCGNHDTDPVMSQIAIRRGYEKEFRASAIRNDPDRVWRKYFGEPFEPVFMKKIKGYTFIASHWIDSESSAAAPAFIEAHRAELEGTRPFFYCQHAPIRGTVNPSMGHYDNGVMRKTLNAFPNAVAFSGHSHNSLTDETSIWQGGFTAVGSGALANSGRRYRAPWYENSEVPGATSAYPGRKGSQMPFLNTEKDGAQGLLVDVYSDRIVFQRRSFSYAVSNGPDWIVPLPVGESRPYAIAPRKAASVPPGFAADAEITTRERDGFNREGLATRQLVVTFPAAVTGTRPHSYEIKVESVSGSVRPVVKYLLSPDFHLPLSRKVESVECALALSGLPAAGDRRITVRSYDSFRNAGPALIWPRGV
jgi:hypothetical protein